MEEREEGKCVDGDGAPPDELRARSPEGRPDCQTDEVDSEYGVAYFTPNVELVCDDGDGRGRCGRGECTIRRQSSSVRPGRSHGAAVHVHGHGYERAYSSEPRLVPE
jgi:hypothetical protein